MTACDLGLPATLPAAYIPPEALRVEIYGRIARADSVAELTALAHELRDRFGAPPPPVRMLLRVGRLRLGAAALGITVLKRTVDALVICGPLADITLPGDRQFPLPLRPIDPETALIPLTTGTTPLQALELLELLLGINDTVALPVVSMG
jgi:transcription-repair coupling factor (superfamily II helicase)